jgi:copper transport protein
MPRLRDRLASVAVGLLIVVAWPSGLVSAHAELLSSDPLPGAHLDQSPRSITLRFSEAVAVVEGGIRLLRADGTQSIDVSEPEVDGSLVTVDVPSLPDGAYIVDWNVVSTDGHPIRGAIPFVVGDAEMPSAASIEAVGDGSPGDTPLLATWRALTYMGLAVVIGTVAFAAAVWPEGRHHRAIGVLALAGTATACLGAVARLLTEASVLDVSLWGLWDLRSGRAWWALLAVAMVSLGAAPLLRSRARQDTVLASLWLFAVAVGVAVAFAGHGATGRLVVLGVVTTVVHVAVVGVWIGGLAALVACVAVAGRERAADAAQRFSTVALWCVVLLLATGVLQATRQLRTVDALTGSDFGDVLLVKSGSVVLLVGAAWWSRRVVRRSYGDGFASASLIHRYLALELGLAVVVFGATGWLAGASPNTDQLSHGPIEVSTQDATGEATAVITITPGSAGTNTASVSFAGDETSSPDELELRLSPVDGGVPPIDVELAVMGDHAMAAPFQLPYTGQWTITVSARYGDFTLRTFETVVEVH